MSSSTGDLAPTAPGLAGNDDSGLPFGRPGRFWRGNLHTHSNRSDGAFSPAETARVYRDAGYDFVAITDHFRPEHDYPVTDTRDLRSDAFTTLIGTELHAPATEARRARPGSTSAPSPSTRPTC